jgi:AcrR family transcriptional regulator
MATRAAILDAAHDVFKFTGYYRCSISEIARRCGMSIGAFYQYFNNKEQIFLELNDLNISRFMARAESLSTKPLSFNKRLKGALRLLYEHMRENFAFHRVLGESELSDRVSVAYYESIARYYRDFLSQEVELGNMRPLDTNMIAYGLIGICYFHSLEWGSTEVRYTPEVIIDLMTDLVMKGISGPSPWKRLDGRALLALPEPVPVREENGKPMTKGEKTREAIFRAAEKVLGHHGFNRANIAEITREAGVAQGTFYIHFASKTDLIEGFVKYLSHKIRRDLQRLAARTRDRRDAERVGILGFLQFVREHREIYHVVPEAEMVSREVSLWYYRKLARGYIQGLKKGMEREEIKAFPPPFLARSLMGFLHIIGLKWILWNMNTQEELPGQLIEDIIEFVLYGLSPNSLE